MKTCIWITSLLGADTTYCGELVGTRKGKKDCFCPVHRAKADAEDTEYLLEDLGDM